MLVHCEAGISRSAGVAAAAAISKYLDQDDLTIFNSHSYYPNFLCYYYVLEALGVFLSEEDLSIREKRNRAKWTNCEIKF